MAISTNAIFLYINGSYRAFRVLQDGYSVKKQKPMSLLRSVYDGRALIVRGDVEPRESTLPLLVQIDGGGTSENDPLGTPRTFGSLAELETAHTRNDLKLAGFGDSAYYDVEWVGEFEARPEYDPYMNWVVVVATLVEKTPT